MVMGLKETEAFIEGNRDIEVYLIYSDKEGNYKVWMSKGFKELID